MVGHSKGDQIDMYDPPRHCGAPMEIWRADATPFEAVCRDDDYGFGIDHDGVILTPPTKNP